MYFPTDYLLPSQDLLWLLDVLLGKRRNRRGKRRGERGSFSRVCFFATDLFNLFLRQFIRTHLFNTFHLVTFFASSEASHFRRPKQVDQELVAVPPAHKRGGRVISSDSTGGSSLNSLSAGMHFSGEPDSISNYDQSRIPRMTL